MRNWYIALVVAAGLGMVSCDRNDKSRGEPAARQAGRQAYDASQELKRDAKEAAKKLKKAGKDFREGWNEAKHEDPQPRKKQ
jgi:hypothetical protein